MPPPREGHHRSARERQRKGPMWGCLKGLIRGFIGLAITLVVLIGGGWWYLGSSNFADYVRKKIEVTLEARLGRDVTIGSVEFVRTQPQKIILNDVRIANAPGGVAPAFATVGQIEITGNVQSFWGRKVQVQRVDIRDPRLWFEVFPAGSALVHNFPAWNNGPPSGREIVHIDIGTLFISNGFFSFNDRQHDISAIASGMKSELDVTLAEDLYEGIVDSPTVRVRLQDYEPFNLDLHGGFRYTPGLLRLRSVALEGRGIKAALSGKLDPLTEGVYNLHVDSKVDLERVRQIFRVEQPLAGTIALNADLRGRQGEFRLTGGWTSPHITADVYELADAKGKLDINGENMAVDVERATYGGGTIGAHYTLANYNEPYPMKIGLRYAGISLEQLFNDWTIQNTGIRSAATGNLTYRWNKDKILEGAGEGAATLAKNAVAYSSALYPIPIAGTTDFALDRGTVTFRSAELDTDASHVSLTGTLKIEEVLTDLKMSIRSSDFSELDRLGYNFAHSAGKKDYTLLGFGGAGTIEGTVRGVLDKAQVGASITGSKVRYNNVLLGDAGIGLRYDGNESLLTFEHAAFSDATGKLADASGKLALEGTVALPENGEPRFDIAVEANDYPAQRAIDAVGLELVIGTGLATGKLNVTGTPESGAARFDHLIVKREVRRPSSGQRATAAAGVATLTLDGAVNWMPGKGNVELDLQITANDFPVSDIAGFLDFGDLPLTGDLTGPLKIAGRKESLAGSGQITVLNGTVMGEPIDLASADIDFTQGRMKAANVLVRSPAGEIRGEAEADLGSEQFRYDIASTSLDLSKLTLLAGVKDLLGGHIVFKSTGAGTFEQPELDVQATLEDATLSGLSLPPGSAPPSVHLAIRNGRLNVDGELADIVTIKGEGNIGDKMAVDGNVRVNILDLARAAAISPATATLPISGNVVLDLHLGGHLTPVESLIVEATVPTLNLRIGGDELTAPEPLRLALHNGRIELNSFVLRRTDSVFAVRGWAEITGAKRLDLNLRGSIEAALLQLFVRDSRAEGTVDVAVSVTGTMIAPKVVGTANLHDAQLKVAGFPQLIDEINGTLRFSSDRIDIDSVRATIGGGRVVTGGVITLDGMAPRSVRITLQGKGVAFRYIEGLTLESNFTLLLTGDLERIVVQGDVDVTRALYFKDFDIQQTLLNVILARNRVGSLSAATWKDRVSLRIHVSAPGTLAMRNNLAEVTASADLDVTGTVANPVILGEITLDEGGTVHIQKVDYRVARGTIGFQNPFRIDPFFDLTIEGTVSGVGSSETESGPYEVTLNLTGTLARLTPTITSDPPASDITLFTILGLGGIGSRSAGAGGVGVFGQSLLYSSLSNLIGSRVFPFVDSFAYDPGTLEAGQGAGARVTFEKRMSNKVRFLLVYNLQTQQSRQVVEWLVNPTWTLQLTRDETDEYRLDARFRRRYEAHWNFGLADENKFASGAVLTRAGSAGASRPAASAAAVTTAEVAVPPPPPVTTVNPRASSDRPIAQINLRADARFDTSAVAQEVTLKPGQLVTIRELQSSIKNLFATGNFRDVRVDAATSDTGVVLTFSLYLHYRIVEVVIEGLERADRTRAQRKLTVHSGEVLSLDNVDDSAAAIEEVLQQNGFLEATVDPETKYDRARNAADVTFHVTPGPQARVVSVTIEGPIAPFTQAQLIRRMKRRPGRTFQLIEAREDAGRIKSYLVRRNYRRAGVEFLGHQYDEKAKTVALRYRVQTGPIVKVAVDGVRRFSVRRWLPFAKNQEYSEDIVDQAADKIVEGLQGRGHYLAAVDTESSLKDNVWTTTFHVAPGDSYELSTVTFNGNQQVNDDVLHKIVATSRPSALKRLLRTLFRVPNGVTREQLSEDRDAIESYYRLQGFSEATAGEPVIVTKGDGTMTVDFPLTEGPQTLLSDVTIEGNSALDSGRLPTLGLRKGAPLNPQLLHDDVVALQTFYASRGNVEVQITPRVEIGGGKTTARVAYVVAEGPQVKVDQVIVRGNTYTKRDVVLRRTDLEPGDPFSYTSMLEAQRELYRLGIFQRVEVQPQQTSATTGNRDVVIQVEEGRNLTLTGSVGLRADRGTNPGTGTAVHERVALAAAHRNLFGTGRYLGVEAVISREQQEAFVTYREPFVTRWNIPVQLQVFQTDDSTRVGASIQQRGMSIEALKLTRQQTRWSLRYEYKISKCYGGLLCDDIEERNPVEGLDRSLLDIQIASLTPTFFWDTRNDIIDPHRGFFTSASIEYAFPLFSADAGFWKESVQGAYYVPLTPRTVIALSGRAGLIQAYARGFDQTLGRDALLPIPISERFTAGGEASHRAFGLDRLGDLCLTPPPDLKRIEGCTPTLFGRVDEATHTIGPILPLGGSSLFLFNGEYRFPIYGPLGGAVFGDVGNVFAGKKIRFGDLRYGAGFGLRYLSPVGPVRIDVARPFDRRWYEDSYQYFITLGYAF